MGGDVEQQRWQREPYDKTVQFGRGRLAKQCAPAAHEAGHLIGAPGFASTVQSIFRAESYRFGDVPASGPLGCWAVARASITKLRCGLANSMPRSVKRSNTRRLNSR